MSRAAENLWERALEGLSDEDKALRSDQNDRLTILRDVLQSVEDKQQICTDKGWKIKRRNGQTVPLRNVFERTLKWVHKFREVGDQIVQFDPGHAALPWAAVRLLLQIAINNSETYAAMVEGVEKVASLIARYAVIEKHYLHERTELLPQMIEAIVQVYGATLIYLSKAEQYYTKSTASRLAKSITQTSESAVLDYLKRITLAEGKAEGLARLIDAEFMRTMEASLHDALDSVDAKMNTISSEVGEVKAKIDTLQTLLAKPPANEQLVRWLDPTFPDKNLEDALSLKVDGTCSWIFEKAFFRNWYDCLDSARLLWIYGGAGFGKSILCASIIEFLQHDSPAPVCFFFCIAQDEIKRKPISILRSWLAQLVSQNRLAYNLALEALEGKDVRSATSSAMWSLFQSICSKLPGCIFVLDGFDECSKQNESSRFGEMDGRVRFLEKLLECIGGTSSRVLLVSRDDAEIRLQLDTHAATMGVLVDERELLREDTKVDIETVSTAMVNQQISNKAADLRSELAHEVASKCDGMFLWIRLLRLRLSRGKNAVQLRKAIADAPAGLEKAYEREMQDMMQLEEDERLRAIRILRLVHFALRPLTVQELTKALLIEADQEHFPFDELPDTWDEDYVNDQIRRLTGSLLSVHGKSSDQAVSSQNVQYVHFSVREFLSKVPEVASPSPRLGHGDLAVTCLRYLCYEEFDDPKKNTPMGFSYKLKQYGFLSYAASFWHQHATTADSSEELTRSIQNLFDRSKSNWISWAEVFESQASLPASALDNLSDPDQLYYAALLGLKDLLDELIEEGFNINRLGGRLGCALQAAAYSGVKDTVQLLLDKGADPSVECGAFISPVAASQVQQSDKASEEILLLLAKAGAFESLSEPAAALALANATVNGGIGSIQILLDHGVSPDAAGSAWEETALTLAASLGNIAAVEVLLRNGASLKPKNGISPLLAAALQDRVDVMKLLLDRNSSSDESGGWHAVVLNVSAEAGSVQAMNLLLARGGDPNFRDHDGWTALGGAARNGHLVVVETLLAQGAVVDAPGDDDAGKVYHDALKPVHASVSNALGEDQQLHNAVVDADAWSLLLATRPVMEAIEAEELILGKIPKLAKTNHDYSTAEAYGWSALGAAAFNGHTAVCKTLLDAGAEINRQNSEGWTPLYSAARGGKTAVVELLLDQGADLLKEDHKGMQAIHAAARGNADTVQLLLDAGADVNSRSAEGWTPLLIASSFGLPNVLRLLLQRGVDMDVISPEGITPLYFACTTSNAETVEVLLDYGADMTLPNADGTLPLFYAVNGDRLGPLEVLLKRGANASAVFDDSPLLVYAASKGLLEITRALLRHGAEINAQGYDKRTALHCAVDCAHVDVIQLLLESGANSELFDLYGNTPLLAACKGHMALVAHLLRSYGASLDVVDMFGMTAVEWTTSDPLLTTCLFKTWAEYHSYLATNESSSQDKDEKTNLLRRSLKNILGIAIDQHPDVMSQTVDALARLLLRLNRLEDATDMLALVWELESTTEEALAPDSPDQDEQEEATEQKQSPEDRVIHRATCDACNTEKPIKGGRLICRTCASTDLCVNHYTEYMVIHALERLSEGTLPPEEEEQLSRDLGMTNEDEELIDLYKILNTTLNRAKFVPTCINHEFVQVPPSDAFDEDGNFRYPPQLVSMDALLEWLKRLREDLDNDGQELNELEETVGALNVSDAPGKVAKAG